MNEVTKINLGRQVFTIAADAQHDLKDYLEDIKKQVSDKDVVDEVEIRMAELLVERGIGAEKVVLKKDVEFLKKQLGSPQDFKDDASETHEPTEVKSTASKRLFRDTDNALLAGVAAGLATYFGIDVLLVRILFIILLFVTVGWGFLLYILLWILVPEAKTASDRLQMAGKPVTVESLKEIAKNADVGGVAKRANASLAGPINRVFSVCLKVVSILITVFGLSVIFGLIAGLVYFETKSDVWTQYNIFPIGTSEHVLLYLAMSVVALAATFVILLGVAIFRRKWPIHSWITGTLAGLLLLGITVCGALGASVYPTVRDAYNANLHTTTRNLQPFDSVNMSSSDVWNINFEYASNYYVTMNYFGRPNLSDVTTLVNNKTLTIDSSQFDVGRNCPILCVPNTYNLSIVVHSPNFSQLQNAELNSPAPPFVDPGSMKPWMR